MFLDQFFTLFSNPDSESTNELTKKEKMEDQGPKKNLPLPPSYSQ